MRFRAGSQRASTGGPPRRVGRAPVAPLSGTAVVAVTVLALMLARPAGAAAAGAASGTDSTTAKPAAPESPPAAQPETSPPTTRPQAGPAEPAHRATADSVTSIETVAPPSTSALLVFIASQSTYDLPLAPAKMRAEVAQTLAEALRPRGLELLEPAAAAALQRRWRVRSGLALDPAFLAAVAAHTGSRTLLVAQVIDAPERVVLDARWVELASGRLLWADAAEAEIPAPSPALSPAPTPKPAPAPASPDTTAARARGWQAGLQAAARQLAAAWREPPAPAAARSPLLVLPAEGVGVDAWQTDVLTHCLLRDLLVERRVAVLDPGVLVACLEAAGHDPAALDAASLRVLGQRFGATEALLSDLISYTAVPRAGEALPPPPDETTGPSPLIAADLALAVRRFDTQTAAVTAASDVFVPAPPATGWFGRPIRFSPLSQLDTACRRLLADGRAVPED